MKNNEGKIRGSYCVSHIIYPLPLLGVIAPPPLLLGKCSSLTLWGFMGLPPQVPYWTPSCPQGWAWPRIYLSRYSLLGQIIGPRSSHMIQGGHSLEFAGIQRSFFSSLNGNMNVTPEWLTVTFLHWMHSQDPSSVKDLPWLLGIFLVHSFWLSAFRDCLSHREPLCPRLPSSLGSLHPKIDWCRSQAISVQLRTTLKSRSKFIVHYGVSLGCIGPAS